MPNGSLNSNFTRFDDIQQYLTGYARMVCYQVYGLDKVSKKYNPYADYEQNLLVEIKEGHFSNGNLHGFGRTIERNTTEVGFYKQGYPYGKFQLYKDGNLARQGIINEFEVKDGDPFIVQRQILSFRENETPPEK